MNRLQLIFFVMGFRDTKIYIRIGFPRLFVLAPLDWFVQTQHCKTVDSVLDAHVLNALRVEIVVVAHNIVDKRVRCTHEQFPK